jgi:hypothetical protein
MRSLRENLYLQSGRWKVAKWAKFWVATEGRNEDLWSHFAVAGLN